MKVMIFSGFLVFLTSYFLSLLIFARSRGRKLNNLWAFFNLAVGTWGIGIFGVGLSRSPDASLWWWKVAHAGGIYIAVLFLHIVCEFTGRPRPLLSRVAYIYSVLFLGSVLSGIAISDVFLVSDGIYYNRSNVWHSFFMVFWFLCVGYALLQLYRHYINSVGLRYKQSQLFFWGTLIGFAGGCLHLLPMWGIIIYPPYGNFSVPLYCLIATYAIWQHQLMDIEVVVKRTLVFAALVAIVSLLVSGVTLGLRKILVQLSWIPGWVPDTTAAIFIVALLPRLRVWLVDLTDRTLFQKKYDYKVLLKKFTDEVMVVIDLKRLVEMTVATLVDVVKLDNCTLLLLNKDTRTYELAASRGTDGRQFSLDEDEPTITFLRQTHEPIWLVGPLAKVRFPESVTDRLKKGLSAQGCLPLYLHDDLIGVLSLGKKKSDEEFSKDDEDILIPLARTLAIAISNAQLFDELAKTQAEAAQKEKLAVIGTLSAGINHEICNPLGIVKAQCEAFLLDLEDGLLSGKPTEEVLGRASTIMQGTLKQIDRATAITQKLSSFAKPIKEPTAQPVSVEQEVDEVLLLVGHDLKLEKIEVNKEIQPDLPPIVVDRRQLQEVLFNLIRNAGQAIKPPGTIWVRAALHGERQVRIEISDTGSGIPPDKLGKIYDPFFTTKEPGRGTGLGLFIVRQLVERNKGRIVVESTVGKGTSFFLDFPIASLQPAGV